MKPALTASEAAALRDADQDGWICPPIYNSLEPEPPRPWRTADIARLQSKRLVGLKRKRADGLFCFKITLAGRKARRALKTKDSAS
jgi:hypothetical protein